MRILVDTSVWSLALRRSNPTLQGAAVAELRELIREARVVMIGPIRQEVLSGIRKPEHYEMLRDKLRAFPDWGVESGDYEKAAEFFNRCRGKGIQGSNTDFLACAIAHRSKFSILTTDQDFEGYARHLPIQLHSPRSPLA